MAAYSSLSPEELAHIVSHYTIGTPLKCETMVGGFGNSNFKLTTDEGAFLLKICDEKTTEELQLQTSLLAHLKKYEYTTPYPILQKDGKALHLSAKYRVMIYPFLNGGTPYPTEYVLRQIGEALAQLHKIPSLFELPRFPMGIAQITPFLDKVRKTQFAKHPFLKWLESELEWIIPELDLPLPTGLLHGDLFLDNTLFIEDQMVAILDFEEGCHDTLLIDVAMTIIGCCYTSLNDLDERLVHCFLEAYNISRPLTEDECNTLDSYVYYAALAIAFWRFRQFNIRRPDQDSANSYKDMIIRSTNWKSICLKGGLTQIEQKEIESIKS